MVCLSPRLAPEDSVTFTESVFSHKMSESQSLRYRVMGNYVIV